MDAFQQDWSTIKDYANPPWCLIGRVLAHVYKQQAQVILIASVWETQPWYPRLLRMLVDIPALLPTSPALLQRMSDHAATMSITPVSRVAYLRNRYTSNSYCLLEQATELMLASWRSKSSKSYDSNFRKWVSWCDKWDCDPTSGPVSEVVNFLADA